MLCLCLGQRREGGDVVFMFRSEKGRRRCCVYV